MAEELLSNQAECIKSLTLVPGSGGIFTVDVDDRRIFSKQDVDRHAEEGEILKLFPAPSQPSA